MIGPYEIAERIDATLTRIDELVAEIRAAGQNAARDEATCKRRFAQERVAFRARSIGKATVDAAHDHATIETADELMAHLLSANNLTTLREVLRAEEAKLDGLRTMAASVRVAGG